MTYPELVASFAAAAIVDTLFDYINEFTDYLWSEIWGNEEQIELADGVAGTPAEQTLLLTNSLLRDVIRTNKAIILHTGIQPSTYEPLEN